MVSRDNVVEVGAFEAKNRLSELLRVAESGRTVIITRHGRAVARLGPIDDDNELEISVLGEAFRNLRSEIPGPVNVRELVEEGRRW